MRKSLFFLGLLILPYFVEAQESKQRIDSLKLALKKGNERQQFNTLILLSDEYSNSNLEQAIVYAKRSLVKAQLVKNDTFIATSYNSIGNVFQYKTELDSALFYHNKALQIRKKIKDLSGIADSYNNIGIIFDTKAEFDTALTNYFKALYYYEIKQDLEKQAMTNTNIGIVYKAQKDYQKAFHYYNNAYQLYVKIKNEFGVTISSGNLGSILINFGKYQESLRYSEIAKTGYLKLGYERYLGYPISNIAFVLDSLHQFKAANENYIQAIKWHEKYKNGYEISLTCITYANCLMKQNKYVESIKWSNKGIQFAEKSDAYLLLIQGYKTISKANVSLGKYDQAYAFLNLYSIGKDSLFANEKTKTVFELEAKYQTEKKEKLLLQKEAEARQKNTLLIGISILTVFIGLIGFLIYRQQKQKISQQKQEYILKKAIAEIETQNKLQEQRLNISRDLHDNIGAQLTFIISSVDTIKYAFDIKNPKLDHKLNGISSFAKETIIELRDTIWAMNSNQISFEDLEIRINNYIEKAKEAKDEISFSFFIYEKLKNHMLTSLQGMNIYRTIQEAVNNAIKYADAAQITIDIKTIDSKIAIHVYDNGKGFDIEKIEFGNGLHNMKKRIEEIAGQFQISSSNKGTRIEILLQKNEL